MLLLGGLLHTGAQLKTIAIHYSGGSKPRPRHARAGRNSVFLSCTLFVVSAGLFAACGDGESSSSGNEEVCEEGEWSNWDEATCETCEDLVFDCTSLDWELDDPRRSTWDGEAGLITVYTKPGRAQIVSARVIGSVVEDQVTDSGPPITVEATIEGDEIRFDVSEYYEEGHMFLATQFFFDEACGQFYAYNSVARNLTYDRVRPLLIDCDRN